MTAGASLPSAMWQTVFFEWDGRGSMWVGYNYSWSRRGLLACTHTSLTCFVKPAGGMTKLDLSYISFGNINQVFFFIFPPRQIQAHTSSPTRLRYSYRWVDGQQRFHIFAPDHMWCKKCMHNAPVARGDSWETFKCFMAREKERTLDNKALQMWVL